MNIRNHPIHPRVVPVHPQSAQPPGHKGRFLSISGTQAGAGPPKDPVPELRRKGVVYTIPCDQCPWCYVSQTGRPLEQRFWEHQRALRKRNVLALAVAEHVFTSGQQMDLCKGRVMDFTLTSRRGVYWSPGTSNASRSLSSEKRAPCQDSTPLC